MKQYRQLTRENRYQIRALLDAGKSGNEIAKVMRFHRSTIYREISCGSVKRRSAPFGEQRYKPGWAHKAYLLRRSRWYNHSKIRGWLEFRIREKISFGWSPQQVSCRLKFEGAPSVSHEAIYRYLLRDKQRGGELYRCLRQYGHRRKRYGRGRRFRAPIANRTPLSQRPDVANLRQETGHWERDLVIGKQGQRALLTIVDRKSRYTLIQSVRSRRPTAVLRATLNAFKRGRHEPKTITNDNGLEFADHLDLTKATQVPVYFTRPYASWERGTNENTNGLIRQYFPKGSSFEPRKTHEIRLVEKALNLRPRRILGYLTPEEVHFGVRKKLIIQKMPKPVGWDPYTGFIYTVAV